MCIQLLLSSPTELPFLGISGDPNDKYESQAITCRTHLTTHEDEIAIFADRLLYIVDAAFTGDGCGFCGNFDEADRCRYELADFIEALLKIESDLTLFIANHDFWGSGELPNSFDCLSPTDIRNWKDCFLPNEYFQLFQE